MKKTYTLKLDVYNFRWRHLMVCAYELKQAFDLPIDCEEIDVIVQTTKPRHNDYHVIEMRLTCPLLRYDNGGHSIFYGSVDNELKRFNAKTLYVSVYA